MVISSLIGVDWTTPVTSLDEYDVQCFEGANGTDGILEAKDGISYSGKIPQERASISRRRMWHHDIRQVDPRYLSNCNLKCNHPPTWCGRRRVVVFVFKILYDDEMCTKNGATTVVVVPMGQLAGEARSG